MLRVKDIVALNLRKFSQKRTITMQNRKKCHRECPLKIVSIPKKTQSYKLTNYLKVRDHTV